MNRRALIQSAAILPAFSLGGVREIRAGLLIGDTTPVNIIVTSHHSPAAAERYRRSWIGNVFETWGEWYVINSEPRPLPDHLAAMPGTMTHHDTLYGEAAEEHEYLVGAFRKEHISCIVRIREDDESLMIDVAEHIEAQSSPGLFESAWSAAQLQRFIPTGEDLGQPISVDNSHFP